MRRVSLYVVAIGAPTNIANALVLRSEIADNIVVVWLGGNPSYLPHQAEFNARQDPAATATLLDSGVALVIVPCKNVAEQLRTTHAEIDRYVRATSAIGAYLADLFDEYHAEQPGYSKPIWDLGATGWVIDRGWTTNHLGRAPLVAQDGRWIRGDGSRQVVLTVDAVSRDSIFTDLFGRLARSSSSTLPRGEKQ
jgi:purine nucleosidase